jgi:glycosyltransferase involved in cell wall biosynthesis
MHWLLIHQAFVSPHEAGGTRHFELARYLQAQGHRITIIASDVSYLTGEKIMEHPGLAGEEEIEGIRIIRAYALPTLHKNFLWRLLAFWVFMITSAWVALKVKDIDGVMGTTPPLFQAVSAWVVASLRRKPFLLEVRDLWPEFAIDMGVLTNPVLIYASRWLEGFLYARATHILVNSPAYRDYLLDRGIPESKVSFIPNGVDTAMFYPEQSGEELRRTWGLQKKFVVTYAGALGQANDIETLLQAAQQLQNIPDIHFLLVGDGKERIRLQQLAETWKLKNVTFTGARPKAEMPTFLAASDACVAILQDIPMFRTTYPNKVFDYMAAGRPTILAIDGVIRQVVEDAKGGVFAPPGDYIALADVVQTLANDPVLTETLGRNARIYVENHFERKEQAHAFETLLQQLI